MICKKFFMLLLTLTLATIAPTFYQTGHAGNQINVYINDQQVEFSGQQPISINDRVFVPIRGVFEQLGGLVTWDNNTAVVKLDNIELKVSLNQTNIEKIIINDGEQKKEILGLDINPILLNGRILLPLRAIGEALGAAVEWSNNEVLICFYTPYNPDSFNIDKFGVIENENGDLLVAGNEDVDSNNIVDKNFDTIEEDIKPEDKDLDTNDSGKLDSDGDNVKNNENNINKGTENNSKQDEPSYFENNGSVSPPENSNSIERDNSTVIEEREDDIGEGLVAGSEDNSGSGGGFMAFGDASQSQDWKDKLNELYASNVTNCKIKLYRYRVYEMVNGERVKAGLPPLMWDDDLAEIAQAKAEDMLINNYFSHTSPTYGSAFDMIKLAGLLYSYAGENIAAGQSSPELVMGSWMLSQSHKDNILNKNYTRMAVGYITNGAYKHSWVQMFYKQKYD